MYISKVMIENFKCFEWNFHLNLNKELNIIVWDNESWKTTILEAIHLALSGWIYWKYLWVELNQSLFNATIVNNYIASLQTATTIDLPKIIIELYFEFEDTDDDSLKALFEWSYNSTKQKSCWIRFEIWFSDTEINKKQYELLLQDKSNIKSLPIDFYEYQWKSFSRDDIKPKIFNHYFSSTFIDSSNYRYQNGCDTEVLKTIKQYLDDTEKINISLAHRKMQDSFWNDTSITPINAKLKSANLSEKDITLSVELTNKSAWEDSLTVYVWNTPFSNSWKWEQCIIKTKLALNSDKTQRSNTLLIEEPENHLSHWKLNKLIKFISDNHINKQIIISTHSSFVANKLWLWSLILLNKDLNTEKRSEISMNDLSKETQSYFSKLSWYDTLRLILCRKAILVEWPSDDLIVQKAYLKIKNKLPIEDEVDIISVWTSFLRFLEIANKIWKPVAVITDNDSDFDNKITKKYSNYLTTPTINICADNRNELNTLEPQFVNANKSNLDTLRDILWLDNTKYSTEILISQYMQNNKTDSALKIFDTKDEITFPQYILDAINWEYEQE